MRNLLKKLLLAMRCGERTREPTVIVDRPPPNLEASDRAAQLRAVRAIVEAETGRHFVGPRLPGSML
jgi:hypothetical protein